MELAPEEGEGERVIEGEGLTIASTVGVEEGLGEEDRTSRALHTRSSHINRVKVSAPMLEQSEKHGAQ